MTLIGLEAGHSHWLLEHVGFQERGLLSRRQREACSLALALDAGSWILALGSLGVWLVVLWLGTFGCKCAWTLWVSGPCSSHDWNACGTGRCWAHQGLRPHMIGSPLLETESHSGLRASLGSSLWVTKTQCSMAHRSWTATWRLSSAPRSQRKADATRG